MMRLAVAFCLSASVPALAAAPDIGVSDAALPASGKIVVSVGEDGAMSLAATEADARTGGALERAIAAADFEGGEGSTLPLYGLAPYDAVLVVGTGEGVTSGSDLQDFGGTVAQKTSGWTGTLSIAVPDSPAIEDDAAHAALGARLGSYDFGKWNSDPDEDDAAGARSLTFHGPGGDAFASDRSAIADGVAFARDLVSTPSNAKTPVWFADQVSAAFAGIPNTSVRIMDVAEMERLGMGALVGVGKGSSRPPRLVVVRYDSPDYDGAPLAFVGKGITFDTGGISLKPPRDMWKMRGDMTGAAVSMGTLMAMAKRGAAVDAVAVGAMAENMPGGAAQRPGDVIRSMSGKTIEIMSTDAEGRLVLTDALWWTQDQYNPRLAVSVATLTGSVSRALGDDYAGLFTQDDELADLFVDAGETSGEHLWRLPLHESTFEDIEADVADVRNGYSGGPGASVGAAFIMNWVRDEQPFVHLDIAGMDYRDSAMPTEPKGWTAYGVRLLDEVARRYEGQ
ncbi:MAG: leucyl aminopeptidase [Pacificimonas sp.]